MDNVGFGGFRQTVFGTMNTSDTAFIKNNDIIKGENVD